MDRETLLRMMLFSALALLVLYGWQRMFPPPVPVPVDQDDTAIEQPLDEQGSQGATTSNPAAPTIGAPGQTDPSEPQFEVIESSADAEPLMVETPQLEVTVSPRGGRVISWRLKEYARKPADEGSARVDLVSVESRALDRYPLQLELPDEELTRRANEGWYQLSEERVTPEDRDAFGISGDAKVLAMRWADAGGLAVVKKLFFSPTDPYVAKLVWQVTHRGNNIDAARILWGPSIFRAEDSESRFDYRGHVMVAVGGDIDRIKPGKVESDRIYEQDPARWLALDSLYFTVAVIPDETSSSALRMVQVTNPGDEDPTTALTIETTANSLNLFAGPKDVELLRRMSSTLNADLNETVDWGFTAPLAKPLYSVLAFFERHTGNWGLAIIIVTFIIRVLFFPLTQRAMVNMRKTQEKMGKLQPKMRKIKEKYAGKRDMESRTKLNEETMALYKKEGVNPMAPLAGCLPMLLQMPVLFAMYSVLAVVIDLRGAPFFGWIQDLATFDPLFITPIVMGVTMLGQQLLALTKVEDPQQKAQQRIMLMMPVMFTFFFAWLPSGLVLYWLTNNVLGIAQQLLINRQAAEVKPATA